MTALVCGDAQLVDALASAIGAPTRFATVADLRRALPIDPQDLVVLGPDVDLTVAAEFAADQRLIDPDVGVVLVRGRVDNAVLGLALRHGIRDVVAASDRQRLQEACRASAEVTGRTRAARGARTGAPAPRGRVVTAFSGKGGAGATSVAVSAAVLLAERRTRVCLIDLDLAFGDVAMALRLFPERTLGNAAGGAADTLDVAAVQALTTRHSSGVHALLAPTIPSAAEHIEAAVVARILEVARELYDVVVVDTPSAFTDPVLAALDVSDAVLLLTTPDIAAAKNHKLVEQTLDALGQPGNRRRLVLNRAGDVGALVDDDLQAVLGRRPTLSVPVSKAIPAAANRGLPVSAFDARDPAVRALRAVADEVAGVRAPALGGAASRENAAPARRNLLGRKVATP